MTFEYTLTLADLRESMAMPRARQDAVWTALVAYAVLLVLAVPLAGGVMGEEPAATLAAAAAGPPRDLWVTLAPSLVGFTLVIAGALAGHRRPRRGATTIRPPLLRRSVPVSVPVVLAFAWIILPNVPALAVHWHPTPRRVLWAAVAPWFAYLIFACGTVLARGRRTAALVWDVQRSIRRPVKLELNDDGVVATDPAIEQRFRWPHIASYRETANLLLLETEDTVTLILPKRAVPDPAAEGHLRTLIQTHVANGAFLPRDAAWPVAVIALDGPVF